jgi:hypothetical protein
MKFNENYGRLSYFSSSVTRNTLHCLQLVLEFDCHAPEGQSCWRCLIPITQSPKLVHHQASEIDMGELRSNFPSMK